MKLLCRAYAARAASLRSRMPGLAYLWVEPRMGHEPGLFPNWKISDKLVIEPSFSCLYFATPDVASTASQISKSLIHQLRMLQPIWKRLQVPPLSWQAEHPVQWCKFKCIFTENNSSNQLHNACKDVQARISSTWLCKRNRHWSNLNSVLSVDHGVPSNLNWFTCSSTVNYVQFALCQWHYFLLKINCF